MIAYDAIYRAPWGIPYLRNAVLSNIANYEVRMPIELLTDGYPPIGKNDHIGHICRADRPLKVLTTALSRAVLFIFHCYHKKKLVSNRKGRGLF